MYQETALFDKKNICDIFKNFYQNGLINRFQENKQLLELLKKLETNNKEFYEELSKPFDIIKQIKSLVEQIKINDLNRITSISIIKNKFLENYQLVKSGYEKNFIKRIKNLNFDKELCNLGEYQEISENFSQHLERILKIQLNDNAIREILIIRAGKKELENLSLKNLEQGLKEKEIELKKHEKKNFKIKTEFVRIETNFKIKIDKKLKIQENLRFYQTDISRIEIKINEMNEKIYKSEEKIIETLNRGQKLMLEESLTQQLEKIKSKYVEEIENIKKKIEKLMEKIHDLDTEIVILQEKIRFKNSSMEREEDKFKKIRDEFEEYNGMLYFEKKNSNELKNDDKFFENIIKVLKDKGADDIDESNYYQLKSHLHHFYRNIFDFNFFRFDFLFNFERLNSLFVIISGKLNDLYKIQKMFKGDITNEIYDIFFKYYLKEDYIGFKNKNINEIFFGNNNTNEILKSILNLESDENEIFDYLLSDITPKELMISIYEYNDVIDIINFKLDEIKEKKKKI